MTQIYFGQRISRARHPEGRADLVEEVGVELLHLEAAQVGDAVAGHAVVVEQPPAAVVLHDAVVRGPAHDGLQ